MEPSWTDITTAVTAAVALVLASFAWFTGMSTVRTTYRPVLRTIPTMADPSGAVSVTALLLKNIGFGPAVSAMLFPNPTPDVALPMAQVPLIERLNDEPVESKRRGRVPLRINGGSMVIGSSYRVLYQDIAGGWHETRFTVRDRDFVMKVYGPYRWYHVFVGARRIPKSARELGHIVRAVEGL